MRTYLCREKRNTNPHVTNDWMHASSQGAMRAGNSVELSTRSHRGFPWTSPASNCSTDPSQGSGQARSPAQHIRHPTRPGAQPLTQHIRHQCNNISLWIRPGSTWTGTPLWWSLRLMFLWHFWGRDW